MMTLLTSTPRLDISSSMKRPKTSSPQTPINATLSPSRAAPHAKIAEEDPIVSAAESTSFSACPNSGTILPLRIRSGLISPATSTLNSLDISIRRHKAFDQLEEDQAEENQRTKHKIHHTPTIIANQ